MHGVCSLDILAAEAIDAGLDEFVVATDARRKEVYLASYAGGRRVSGPEVVKPVDAKTDGPVVGRGGRALPGRVPERRSGRSTRRPSVLCDVVVNRRFEILAAGPALPAPPDAAEPGKPKRVS